VAPDSARRIQAHALGAKTLGRTDHFFGYDPVLDDFLLVVKIVEEKVQRLNALLQPALNPVPLLGADHARHDIEWENTLGAGGIAVNIEGDSELEQGMLGSSLTTLQFPGRQGLESLDEGFRLASGRIIRRKHLVEKPIGTVAVKFHDTTCPVPRTRATAANRQRPSLTREAVANM